jgi:hypothetical protein
MEMNLTEEERLVNCKPEMGNVHVDYCNFRCVGIPGLLFGLTIGVGILFIKYEILDAVEK